MLQQEKQPNTVKRTYERVRNRRDALKLRMGMIGVAAVAGIGNVTLGVTEWLFSREYNSSAFNVAAAHDIFGDGLSYGLQISALMFASRDHEVMSRSTRNAARLLLIGMSAYFATKAGHNLLTGAEDISEHGVGSTAIAVGAMAVNGSLLWFDHNHEADFHDHPVHETVSEHEETSGDIVRHIATDAIEGSMIVAATALSTIGLHNADQWSVLVGQTAATGIMAWPWLKKSPVSTKSH